MGFFKLINQIFNFHLVFYVQGHDLEVCNVKSKISFF